MPIIRSAKKKVRKDRIRSRRNLLKKANIKKLIKEARRSPNPKTLSQLQSALDKAAKTKFIHANTASRLKARLSKLSSSAKTVTRKLSSAKKNPPVKKAKKKV